MARQLKILNSSVAQPDSAKFAQNKIPGTFWQGSNTQTFKISDVAHNPGEALGKRMRQKRNGSKLAGPKAQKMANATSSRHPPQSTFAEAYGS